MATAPLSRRLNLTRDQLAEFLTDQQQIRQFELLFSTVDTLQVIVGTDFEYQADNAAATANEALAQLSALAQDTAVDDAVLNAKVQQALDAIPRLAQALELIALAPANYETGTFTITPFTNNSINIDTTTNFQVGNLVSGANYRVEWNFNYNILTSVSSNGLFTFTIRNQSDSSLFLNSNQITTGMRTFVNSMSGVRSDITGFKFTVERNALSSGSFTGATPLNLNCVISVIEM
jgi:hypothetical protein